MATSQFHHSYKVVYELKESNGFWGAKRVEYVEAAMAGMAKQQVIESYGGPLKCQVWSAEQVD